MAPIVITYGCVLSAVIGMAVGVDGIPTTWIAWSSMRTLLEYLMIAASAVGIWMAAVWVALCGANVLVRAMYAALLIGGATWGGVFEYAWLQGDKFFEQHFEIMLFIILMCAFGFFAMCAVPLLATRWLLSWRVVLDPDREDLCAAPGYSVTSMLRLTAAVAVGCTALTWVTDALSVSPQGGFYIASAAVLSVGGLLQLPALCWFRMRFVWPASFLLTAFLVAALATLQLVYLGRNLSAAVDPPTLGSYTSATLMVLITASYLRRRGVLIRCGGTSGFGAECTPAAAPETDRAARVDDAEG